jgi:hypothetical protein
MLSSRLSRLDEEGRFAVVTSVEAGCDGRNGLQRDHLADERSDAHGEIVWSWHPGADAKPALRRARGRRGQKSRSPGRVRISRKAVAQGGRAFSAEPVVLPRAFCCTRTAGASRRPASLRPLLSQRVMSSQSSDANAPRERRHLAPPLRGATRRSSLQSRQGAGEVLDRFARKNEERERPPRGRQRQRSKLPYPGAELCRFGHAISGNCPSYRCCAAAKVARCSSSRSVRPSRRW